MSAARGIAVFFVSLALGFQAQAATVEVNQGPVSLNRGAGFLAISGATNAKAGDQVMVGPAGRAKISYGEGCILEIEPQSVVVVPADSACAAGQKSAGANPYLIGGAIVVGGAAAAVLLSGGGSSKSASP